MTHAPGIEYPYIRNVEGKSLTEFSDSLAQPTKVTTFDIPKVKVTKDTVTFVGGKTKVEVPFTHSAMESVSDLFGAPPKFIERQDPEVQALFLNTLAKHHPGGTYSAVVSKKDDHLIELHDPSKTRFLPEQIMECVTEVMPSESLVTEWWNNSRMFQADIVLPATARKGVSNKAKVGDITRGGLRVGLQRSAKQAHAPWVSGYLYRLECTNGQERCDHETKVDARIGAPEDVMAEYLKQCHIVFDRLDDYIAQFYALRDEPIAAHQADTILRRTLAERGLKFPGGEAEKLQDIAISVPDPTMFDIVNIITNAANNPQIINKPASRRKIEMAGGSIVHDSHVTRCPQCLTKMS